MLVDDLAEVLKGLIGESEALRRVAGIGGTSDPVRNFRPLVADGVEREVDVARAQAAGDAYLSRISLVEDVEEPGPELNLLRFADLEVLEERNVEVAPAGSP